MENIPASERKNAMASFGRVGVVQPNKIQKQMAICQKCCIVIPVSEYDIWKHWKFNCAHKLSFKYVYPTDPTEKTKVECLLCRKKFDNVTLNFMAAHRFECMKKTQSYSANSLLTAELPPPAKKVALSSQIESNDQRTANNNSVSTTTPIDLNQLQFDKFRFVMAGSKPYYGAQCRLCKEVFLMDTMKLLQHRTQCKSGSSLPSSETNDSNSDSEVLITVQTVHTSLKTTQNAIQSAHTTNPSDNSTAAAAAATTTTAAAAASSSKFCFVCNAASNDSFVKMFGSVSTCSKKSIYDFIWKFLDNKPSVRHATADASNLNDEVICSECFKMICNYDLARSHAKRLKKQIRQMLTITETYFEQTQNRMDVTDTATEGDDDDENQQQQNQPQQRSDMSTMECEVIDLCDDD